MVFNFDGVVVSAECCLVDVAADLEILWQQPQKAAAVIARV